MTAPNMSEELRLAKKMTSKMIIQSDRIDMKKHPYKMHLLAGAMRDSAHALRNQIAEMENTSYEEA